MNEIQSSEAHLRPPDGKLNRRMALGAGPAAAAAGLLAADAVGQSRQSRPAGRSPSVFRSMERAAAAEIPGVLQLYINDGYLPMVDGSLVYHRGFGHRPTSLIDPDPCLSTRPQVITASNQVIASRSYPLGAPLPHQGTPAPQGPDPAHAGEYLVRRSYWGSYLPERTILAETGATIRMRIHNRLAQPHEITFHHAADDGGDVGSGPIPPGSYRELDFPAPLPGSYIYSDPTNAPVERVLGLFGALVVVDPSDPWCIKSNWIEFERQWIWICHDLDPVWAEAAARGETIDPRDRKAVPRYFTLNGRAGYESLGLTKDKDANARRNEDTLISGVPRHVDIRDLSLGYTDDSVSTGQLLRLVNPGIVFHQMHFHGNHLWIVRRNGHDFPRSNGYVDDTGHVVLQQWEDVIELEPMDRKKCVIPLKRPPDATDAVWNNRYSTWQYPMHCHAEPSQTAAGGMYPGGLVAHWSLAHPESRT